MFVYFLYPYFFVSIIIATLWITFYLSVYSSNGVPTHNSCINRHYGVKPPCQVSWFPASRPEVAGRMRISLYDFITVEYYIAFTRIDIRSKGNAVLLKRELRLNRFACINWLDICLLLKWWCSVWEHEMTTMLYTYYKMRFDDTAHCRS